MTFSQKLSFTLVIIALVWPLVPIADDQPLITINSIISFYKQQIEKINLPTIDIKLHFNNETASSTASSLQEASTIIKAVATSKTNDKTIGTPIFPGRQASLTSQTVYFWKEDGTWNFSNQEPENPYETWILNPNENIVSLHSSELNESTTQLNSSTENAPNVKIPSGLPYSDIPKLIEEAKNIQKLADNRGKALESIAY